MLTGRRILLNWKILGNKGFFGGWARRMGKWGKTIASLVWGLLRLRCSVDICSGYLFCNEWLQTYWHKTTTVLLFSGILWVRNLDRAQLGWLISLPLGLGPLLGKFQWLGAEIICSGIGTEWPKSWAQLGTACGSTYTWPHPVAPPSQLLVTGSPVGASEAWVY